MNEKHNVMTVAELARTLRINRKTAYAGLRSGDIPGSVKIGRTIRVSRQVLIDWLDDSKSRGPHSRRKR